MELGRLHERRGEVDEAWMCYDHVQNIREHLNPRDDFLTRLTGKMDGDEKQPWSQPTVEKRDQFLQQMVKLSQRVSKPNLVEETVSVENEEIVSAHPDLIRLQELINNEDFSEAFFLSRRLVAQGEDWAEEWLDKAKLGFGE
jgi:hypothetical protein